MTEEDLIVAEEDITEEDTSAVPEASDWAKNLDQITNYFFGGPDKGFGDEAAGMIIRMQQNQRKGALRADVQNQIQKLVGG